MNNFALITPLKKCKAGIALFGTTAILATGLIGWAPAHADEAPATNTATSATAEATLVTAEATTPLTEKAVTPEAVATQDGETQETPAVEQTPVIEQTPAANETPAVEQNPATSADAHAPSWAGGAVKPGESLVLTYTGDNITVPAVATLRLPEGWINSYDASTRSFTVTAPISAQGGSAITVPITVIYEDGSTDFAEVPVTIEDQSAPLNELYAPSWEKGTIKPGETITLQYTGNEIDTKAEATFTYPSGWIITSGEDNHDFVITAPTNAPIGYQLILPITITYADGTTDTAEITVTVVSDDAVAPAPVLPAQPVVAPAQPTVPEQPVANAAIPAQPAVAASAREATQQPELAHTGAISVAVLSGTGLLLLAGGVALLWGRRRSA